MSSSTTVIPAAGTETRVRHEPPYNVVLLDDNDHTFDYVIEMLRAIFGYSRQRGFEMAWEVHTRGRVVCETTHREKAELRVQQIHGYGADPRLARSRGSMSALAEPAP